MQPFESRNQHCFPSISEKNNWKKDLYKFIHLYLHPHLCPNSSKSNSCWSFHHFAASKILPVNCSRGRFPPIAAENSTPEPGVIGLNPKVRPSSNSKLDGNGESNGKYSGDPPIPIPTLFHSEYEYWSHMKTKQTFNVPQCNQNVGFY